MVQSSEFKVGHPPPELGFLGGKFGRGLLRGLGRHTVARREAAVQPRRGPVGTGRQGRRHVAKPERNLSTESNPTGGGVETNHACIPVLLKLNIHKCLN